MTHQIIRKEMSLYGSKVRYWEYNSRNKNAPVIFALHGFRGTHHGLEDIVKKLPEISFIIPDLPGFNESSPMKSHQHDIAGYSAFATTFIQTVVPSKSILLGHSFGSIIAADVAAKKPANISKLILINPIAKSPSSISKALANAYYKTGTVMGEKSSRFYFSNKASVFMISVYLAKTKDKKLRSHIHNQHLTHFSSYSNRTVMKESFSASISTSVSGVAQSLSLPTLLIAGKKDGIAKIQDQQMLQKDIKNSKLYIAPKTGHLVHYEAPQFAADAITDFLAS